MAGTSNEELHKPEGGAGTDKSVVQKEADTSPVVAKGKEVAAKDVYTREELEAKLAESKLKQEQDVATLQSTLHKQIETEKKQREEAEKRYAALEQQWAQQYRAQLPASQQAQFDVSMRESSLNMRETALGYEKAIQDVSEKYGIPATELREMLPDPYDPQGPDRLRAYVNTTLLDRAKKAEEQAGNVQATMEKELKKMRKELGLEEVETGSPGGLPSSLAQLTEAQEKFNRGDMTVEEFKKIANRFK